MKHFLIIIIVFIFSVSPALATDTEINLSEIFTSVCNELEVPQNVVMAIAKVESGFNPWALNIQGKSYNFQSKEKALAKAKEAWAAGRSFDTGIMQVNNWWLKKYNIPLESALDSEANIYLGAWILKEEIERHSTLKAAIGAYHSPKAVRANKYSNLVMASLNKNSVNQIPKSKNKKEAQVNNLTAKKTYTSKRIKNKTIIKSNSPMLVSSKTLVLAKNDSMKIYHNANSNSMKVNVRK